MPRLIRASTMQKNKVLSSVSDDVANLFEEAFERNLLPKTGRESDSSSSESDESQHDVPRSDSDESSSSEEGQQFTSGYSEDNGFMYIKVEGYRTTPQAIHAIGKALKVAANESKLVVNVEAFLLKNGVYKIKLHLTQLA